MIKTNNLDKYNQLRSEFSCFFYESHQWQHDLDGFRIRFNFNLSDIHFFHPELFIPNRQFYNYKNLTKEEIDILVFHIGMVELISYWKCACPGKVVIKPYSLTKRQIDWWKKLYYHGLGEFFYLNSIETDLDSFMQLTSNSEKSIPQLRFSSFEEKTMVPIGGGKDSIVTLEVLKRAGLEIIPMGLNPGEAITKTIMEFGNSLEESCIVYRTIDPKLLELNEKGFLNGHTPFSALLAFVTVFLAAVSGIKNIALSNESSANESTVLDSKINHQYSKSFEFEQDVRSYINQFIHKDINYYSFLRPLNELQIAKLFSGFEKYHNVFRSCNAGSKTNSWCCNCSKCLFTWIILSPFVDKQKNITIFGDDLIQNYGLKDVLYELTGLSPVKPFECVGTIEEVNSAILQSFKNDVKNRSGILQDLYFHPLANSFDLLLNSWNQENFLKTELRVFLFKAINND